MEFLTPFPISTSAAIFSFILFFFSLLFLTQKISNRQKQQSKAPLEAAGAWPIIGHLHLLGGQQPLHIKLGSWADKYGPIFSIKLGVYQYLVVSDSKLAKECFTTNDKIFSSRSKSLAVELMGYNYALFALGPYGPYWRQVRKMVMLEFLSHRRIEMMAHIQVSEIKSSLKTIYDNCLRKENGLDNVKVEMMEYFEHLTLNTTVRMLVGKSYLAEEEDGVRVQKALKKLVDLLGTLMVSDMIPYLRWLDLGGYQKIMRKTWKDMDDILEAWLKEHRERRDLGLVKGEQHDFMDAMLAHVDGAADDDFPGFDADTVNKAVCLVNRDLLPSEMQTMRRKLEYLQKEHSISRKGVSSDEVQVLRERISWLETTNKDLSQKLHEYHGRCGVVEQCEPESQEGCIYFLKRDGLKRDLQSMNSNYSMGETTEGENYRKADELAVKEWEHTLLQNTMGIELNELNKRLEQKESEMKFFGWSDTEALKQHYGRKIMELEEEKRIVQEERDCLLAEIERLAACDGPTLSVQKNHTQNLEALEVQILGLKMKQDGQLNLLKQKQRSDEAVKRLKDEIHSIKAQKVQLQHKIKQEAERFRQRKASHEKELLQLRKEGRRNEYERHKLQALNQRQKMVVQRKTEEAAIATKRLKQVLEARKSTARDNLVYPYGNSTTRKNNEKTLQRWLDHELEVMVNVHAVRFEYEKQQQIRAALAEELTQLKQVDQFSFDCLSPGRGEDCSRVPPMSPNARSARTTSLENMLSSSSDALVSMASQLSEAEQRERSSSGHRRWNLLQSMGDAKKLLQYMFNVTTDARCRLWEMELEMKEMNVKLKELITLLQQNEAQRIGTIIDHKLKEQAVAIALAISSLGKFSRSLKLCANDMSSPSPTLLPAPKQLKYTPGIANKPIRDSAAFLDQSQKMIPIRNLSMKKVAYGAQGGKLWKWERSHHRWLLQFKFRWQKPWKLGELLRHSDEIIMSSGNNVIVR